MSKEILGTLCTDASDNFGCGFMHGMCKTIKARGNIGVVEMEVKVIGQLEGGYDMANRVYDKTGLSPTIRTFQGGGLEPKIIENIPCKLDKVSNGKNGKFSNLESATIKNVGSETASTITARYYKEIGSDNDNVCIVAMRGRNPDNPSDRTTGSPTEQRLEPNSQGICNTLTSVQKDNMVLIKQATKDGYIECEVGGVIDMSFPTSKTRRGRVQDGGKVSPTIMANNRDICKIESRYRIRKLTPLECWRLMGFSDEDFLAAKLGSREEAQKLLEQYPHLGKRAFTEAQRKERISNSQLYKQAGNSIVKLVLMAILGQMIEGKEDFYKTVKEE